MPEKNKKNKQRSMCISEVSLQLLVSRVVITASLSDWNCMCFPCQCLPQISTWQEDRQHLFCCNALAGESFL